MKANKIVFSEEAHNNIVEVAKLAERERMLKIIDKFAEESDVDGRRILFEFGDKDLAYNRRDEV